ncbi:MAG: hypothetical protein IOC82_01315 [Aestuariivirga sp.]|uniref:hypothetical protein n=1 Tax=Aestuariivirga sp. TaxID=2650926 RepID=UPI0025BC5114|nr:hypothetical protein [Aestuariivirga sp.]MCA3559652.1 hypothetical protein [Aestuariivirga sp.]
MPVLERDPWRLQFFEHVPCPDHVDIPTDDSDCWQLFPAHRWIYDKLKVAETQGLAAGPHGVMPASYPVFSKPVTNLKGMGLGSRVIRSAAEMEYHYQPGHMWMPLLEGDHVSTDCAIENGRIAWLRHATGTTWNDGMFRYWTVHAEAFPYLTAKLADWVSGNMAGYTGMLNFETIGSVIIEAHLRFADQWCDLYGEGWVEALAQLYAAGRWAFADGNPRDGFSMPLFARHGSAYRHPSPALQAEVRAMPEVRSLQITFHEHKRPDDHAMPPGGFRLAVINAASLAAARAARRRLAEAWEPGLILSQD